MNGTPIGDARDVAKLDFDKGGGVVTVVAQDARSGAVLMVAHADREAVQETLRTGEMHYRSRTRGLWHKGATSGNVQRLRALVADCDGDTLLATVEPAGPACHTGAATCFGEPDAAAFRSVLAALDRTIAERASGTTANDRSYTRKLLADRNLRLKKLGEESAELVLACADGDVGRATNEAADVVYHVLVALRALGVGLEDIQRALHGRSVASAPIESR